MSYTERLKKSKKSFRRLTGITPGKFDEIFEQFKPRYEKWDTRRLSHPGRKRAIGAGGRRRLCLEDRLLMFLIYYRCYLTHAFLAFLFRMDDSNVGRNMEHFEELLAGIFRIPEKRIEVDEDEVKELFIDATEQRVHRPKKGQSKTYSGKKKAHTRKVQVASSKRKDNQGKTRTKVEALSKSHPGKVHDKKIYQRARMRPPPGIKPKADLGYQATTMELPHKKPRKRELTKQQKRENKKHSSARISVEHAIGKMKIWRIAADRYRGKRKEHTLAMKTVAGLANLMYA